MRHLFSIFLTFICFLSVGQIDVQSYSIELAVSDTSDVIDATNTILIEFTEDCTEFSLDLISKNEEGKGMEVIDIQEFGQTIKFQQFNNKLIIYPMQGKQGGQFFYKIDYRGIPIDGLVIGTNKFEERTFFGDNWPNRARNWFPCVDHPSDKASISYRIFAPSHYSCIANGEFDRRNELPNNLAETIYRSIIPLPTKVMVVGIADFALKNIENKHGFPHSIWAYKRDKKNGFFDMDVAPSPLNFFIEKIGPYPYEKLANVQSTTRFGGMENAGCIFYDEDAVNGQGKMENLIAHEIAHQWFGNSASESDWQHIWLSEGFATYFTNLYLENKYGRDQMNEQLIKDRDRVINFSHSYLTPIIDTVSTELMYLLNPNSYQKGSWVLHMLRNKVGKNSFWAGIRAYYEKFKYSNASSNDFIEVMQAQTDIELSAFFDQWLRKSGHPILKTSFNKGQIEISQLQPDVIFTFPLEVEFVGINGDLFSQTFQIDERTKKIKIEQFEKIKSYKLDPKINLLFENVE